jgi:hypothetical protein
VLLGNEVAGAVGAASTMALITGDDVGEAAAFSVLAVGLGRAAMSSIKTNSGVVESGPETTNRPELHPEVAEGGPTPRVTTIFPEEGPSVNWELHAKPIDRGSLIKDTPYKVNAVLEVLFKEGYNIEINGEGKIRMTKGDMRVFFNPSATSNSRPTAEVRQNGKLLGKYRLNW